MICLFCKKPLHLDRTSLRFAGCDEFSCERCTTSDFKSFFGYDFSRYIEHRDNYRTLKFQDVSIGMYNMEHNLVTETTKISEWKKTGKYQEIALHTCVTIPLNQHLNLLSKEELEKKIKLYMTFS